jgi:predicted Zn-dependent protease
MKKSMTRSILLPAVLLFASLAFAADVKPGQSEDPILRDMQAEMARSKEQLKLENVSAPYFIDYRVMDVDSWEADAALGGIRAESRSHVRFLLVQVRIGDYKQDSSIGHGEGAIELAPLDGDERSFRFQLWSATDKAYKQAAEALTDKQARLKQLTIDHPVDDFARAEPVHSVQPLVELKFEREPWLRTLASASALYTTDPKVESLDSTLKFVAINRYYVNSEGSVVRSGEELYHLGIHAGSQAEDGMRMERNFNVSAGTLKDLPTAEQLQDHARTLLASLKELREAPLADEEYHGPVLFSGRAASTVFENLIGDNLLGHKPELGQNARVRGQFASSYKTRVLPDFFAVSDDPSLTEWEGKTLIGHYEVDDEGVQAQRVPLIEKGVLVNYLVGREPIRDFPVSNGHGRAALPLRWPEPSLGNLVVRSTEPVPADELKQRLIAICKDRGLDYGYYVKAMAGIRAPRMLYRVWTKDGHEELVRGALFGDLDYRSMRSSIVAAGNDASVENETQPLPHSIVAPSILFDDLEIKRQTSNKDKLPEYPAPQIAAK